MTNNDSTWTKERGQRPSKTHRILAIFIIATGLAAGGTAVFLRSPAKAIVTNTPIIVPSKPMQGCLVLLSGTVGTNFHIPWGMAAEGSGDLIVSDSYNNTIRKISRNGSVSTIAGTGADGLTNGPARTASFRQPIGVAAGLHGEIYVADTANHVIRKIDAGIVTTFAGSGEFAVQDGDATHASFEFPTGIAIDHHGNLLVSDSRSETVRMISPGGTVSTIAGSGEPGFIDGSGKSAQFSSPGGIAIAPDGSIYVADEENNAIRKMSPIGEVTVFAGNGKKGNADGVGSEATFNYPIDLALDSVGNVFVLDQRNHLIRKISAAGVVSKFATTSPSEYEFAYGITSDKYDNLYISYNSGIVRKVSTSGEFVAIAGPGQSGLVNGPVGVSRLAQPSGLATDRNGNVYVADFGNKVIRKVFPDGRTVIFAGSGKMGHDDGIAAEASFSSPTALAVDSKGNVYVSDEVVVRKISPDGAVTTVAGQAKFNQLGDNNTVDGPALKARFSGLGGLAVDKNDNIYVADSFGDRIRKISTDGFVTPVAGGKRFSLYGSFGYDDGDANSATFHSPQGIAVDASGNIYVADMSNNAIRKISAEGDVSTLAGGKAAYAAIRDKGPIEGRDPGGFADGQGGDAQFRIPIALVLDMQGNLLVADAGNRAIRRVTPTGYVSTVVGTTLGTETVLGELPTAIARPSGVALLPDGQLVISVPEALVRTVGKAQCAATNGGAP
jgi:sugar lactone lactonase YvrE